MATSKSSNRKSRFDNPDLFGGIQMKPIEPPAPTKEHTDEKKEEDMKNNIPEKKTVTKKNTPPSKTLKNQSEELTPQNTEEITKKSSNDSTTTVETSEQEREVVKRGRGKSNNKLYTHSAYLTEKQTDFLYASTLMTGNKVNKSDIIRKALDFYIECHPDEYERAMTFLEIINNAKC